MNNSHYTPFAICLHWLMALLLILQVILGVYMHDLPLSPWKLQIYAWHKWAGVSLFILVSLRIVWRLSHRPPDLPASIKASMKLAATQGHYLLYLLMIAIPLSGWMMSSAKGYQTVYFGVLPIPDLLAKDKSLGDLLKVIHESLNYLFVTLVIGHVGAAFKHHFYDKDQLLLRMSLHRNS